MTGYAIIVLAVYLVLLASIPIAGAEIEIRRGLRSGNMLYNDEVILAPFQYSIFHRDTAASTDTEAFAITRLSPDADNGITIAQSDASTVAATQTGFFNAILPNFRILDLPGPYIGQGTDWAGAVEPIRPAGLPMNTTMTFPDMTMIVHVDNATGNRTNASSIIDANNSRPLYPGNMMLVRNVTRENGRNETELVRVPRDYHKLIATPDYIANRTIMERMWRNVHLNYYMDQAYSGETCFPDLVCPVKNPFTVMYFLPMNRSIGDALILTRPGQHIKKLFWGV